MLIALFERSFVFLSFLIDVVECHQVPHGDVGSFARSAQCLINNGIFEIKLVFYATSEDAAIPCRATHLLFIVMVTLKMVCLRIPTVSDSSNTALIFCGLVFEYAHGAFERTFSVHWP